MTNFATRGTAYAYTGKYHAAEDFECPAGTPVYAGADGRISFSGAMAGYGWLIAIDHPAANAYTLYGHLSPSQWHRELGAVGKGDLIGYIGGTFENGTSVRYGRIPPHLHFAIRAGQRSDYPGIGEWRWQAGWVKACPQDLGWLQPSAVLASQAFPIGGSVQLDSALLERFASELLVVGIFLSSAACGLIWARRRTKPHLVLFFGTVLVVGGWLASRRGMTLATVILATGAVLIAVGVFALARHGARSKPGPVD